MKNVSELNFFVEEHLLEKNINMQNKQMWTLAFLSAQTNSNKITIEEILILIYRSDESFMK